MNGTFEATDSY